jgi:hypothetical protein
MIAPHPGSTTRSVKLKAPSRSSRRTTSTSPGGNQAGNLRVRPASRMKNPAFPPETMLHCITSAAMQH